MGVSMLLYRPESIAYVQCAGSRDLSKGVAYCSRVCCMYAIKQAMLLAGALPLADVTIYHMDIRTFGKGFEQFYQNAKAMGIQFVKAKVARIAEDDEENPVVRVEILEEDGRVEERRHDLVVLSLGLVPGWDPREAGLAAPAEDGFLRCAPSACAPTQTCEEGVFVAGAAAGIWPAWFPVLVFLPFLADASVTLAKRALAGERVWEAHRSHYYQRLVRAGFGHRGTLAVYGALMVGCGATAVACAAWRPGAGPLALAAWVAIVALVFGGIDYHWRQRG